MELTTQHWKTKLLELSNRLKSYKFHWRAPEIVKIQRFFGLWNLLKEIERMRLVFFTFLECSQMPVVFYQSVIDGLGFVIC